MTNHHYDNSERLEGVSEQDWREALDELTAYLTWRLCGKASPRLRMNLALRNSPADRSQRMLNALEPGRKCPFIVIALRRKR